MGLGDGVICREMWHAPPMCRISLYKLGHVRLKRQFSSILCYIGKGQTMTKVDQGITRRREKNRNNNPSTTQRNPALSGKFPKNSNRTLKDKPTVTKSDVCSNTLPASQQM